MIRRPPRSTLFPYNDALPISVDSDEIGRRDNGDRPDLQRVAAEGDPRARDRAFRPGRDRKSTRLNSSHQIISYAVFSLKKKHHTATAPYGPTRTPPLVATPSF